MIANLICLPFSHPSPTLYKHLVPFSCYPDPASIYNLTGWNPRLSIPYPMDMSLYSCGYKAEAQQVEKDHSQWCSSLTFVTCIPLNNLLSCSEPQVPSLQNWERKTHLMVLQRGTSDKWYVKSLARCLEQKSLSKMAVAVTLVHVIFKYIYWWINCQTSARYFHYWICCHKRHFCLTSMAFCKVKILEAQRTTENEYLEVSNSNDVWTLNLAFFPKKSTFITQKTRNGFSPWFSNTQILW